MWLFFFITIFIVFFGLLGMSEQKYKVKIYMILVFGLLTFLAAFRSDRVGNDTISYIEIFHAISIADDLSTFMPRFEIGYVYLNKILSLVVSHPQIVISVTAVVTMFGFAVFIYRYSKIPYLSVFLFFTLGYYGMTLNTIRLNLAIALILFAYDYLVRRKLLGFVIMIALAAVFHRTAIVFLIAWFISKMHINKRTFIFIIVCSLAGYLAFPFILSTTLEIFPTYQYYVGSVYLNGELRVASVINFIIGVIIVMLGLLLTRSGREINTLNCEKDVRIGERDHERIMLLLIAAGCSLLFVSFNFNLLDRIGDYFLVFSIVYLPNIIHKIRDNHLKWVMNNLIILLFFLYALIIQLYRPEWNRIYPYDFFW